MTKQLAPIEELALATGLILKTTNLELCPSYLNKLEQLRQADIRDFVNTLEPVAWRYKAIDKLAKDKFSEHITTSLEYVKYMLSGQNLVYDFEIEPLYGLSEWSKKK